MEGAVFGATKEIDKPIDCVKHVGSNPHAISFASTSFRQDGVKVLPVDGIAPEKPAVVSGAYLLSRPLILLTPKLPQGNTRRFIDFMISTEGQALMAKYFVPLR